MQKAATQACRAVGVGGRQRGNTMTRRGWRSGAQALWRSGRQACAPLDLVRSTAPQHDMHMPVSPPQVRHCSRPVRPSARAGRRAPHLDLCALLCRDKRPVTMSRGQVLNLTCLQSLPFSIASPARLPPCRASRLRHEVLRERDLVAAEAAQGALQRAQLGAPEAHGRAAVAGAQGQVQRT